MKILDLVVKHKWYDMEESGEKPEEYRALSDHWVKRFLRIDTGREGALRYLASLPTNQVWQEYTHVRLHRGYTSTTMLFEIKREIATCAGEDSFAAYLILKRETLHTSK